MQNVLMCMHVCRYSGMLLCSLSPPGAGSSLGAAASFAAPPVKPFIPSVVRPVWGGGGTSANKSESV